MKLRAIVYPNNEVRIALYPERLPSDYFKKGIETQRAAIATLEASENNGTHVSSESELSRAEGAFNIKSKVDTPNRPPRLFLSRNGRRQILRAGSCFNNDESTERLLLTGTLPGRLSEAHKALAEFSTYATKTLTNWLTRRSPGCKWMYTWEFQERGALHVHLVVELPHSVSAYVKSHFKDEWNRIITSISEKSGVDLRKRTKKYSHKSEKTQADWKVCDREPSRYISKYISKSKTSAFSKWRYPPKTWYQISRALLRVLREKTKVYECESLSYRQARKVEEAAGKYLDSFDKSGSRRFDGSVYAWSGYGYGLSFDPTQICEKLMKKNQHLLSVPAIASIARQTMKVYPAGSCFVRAATHSDTFTLMDQGKLSDTELLLYVDAVIKTLSEGLPTCFNPYKPSMFLKTINEWYLSKFGWQPVSPEVLELADKICKLNLTEDAPRTKVKQQQLSFEFDRPYTAS